MDRRAADTCRLPEETVLRQVTGPRWLCAVAGAEPEDAGRRIVRLVLEVRPLALAVLEAGAGLEQQDVETTCGELLGHDRATAACTDDDHVMHSGRLPCGLANTPSIPCARPQPPGNASAASRGGGRAGDACSHRRRPPRNRRGTRRDPAGCRQGS